MATEPNNPAQNTSDTEGNAPKTVTFSDEQQAKLQQIIDASVGRATGRLKSDHEAQLADLKAQLAEARATAASSKGQQKVEANDEVATLRAQIEEMKNAGKSTLSEVEHWKKESQTYAEQTKAAQAAALEIRKEHAITSAAQRVGFIDLEDVVALTARYIKFDDELKKFVAVTESGQTRMNAAYEPMSLDEFFSDYATKKRHLVRTDVLFGTGSTESSRAGLASNGKYVLTDIFGPKSSGAKSQALYKENKAEWLRLKEEAQKQKLL